MWIVMGLPRITSTTKPAIHSKTKRVYMVVISSCHDILLSQKWFLFETYCRAEEVLISPRFYNCQFQITYLAFTFTRHTIFSLKWWIAVRRVCPVTQKREFLFTLTFWAYMHNVLLKRKTFKFADCGKEMGLLTFTKFKKGSPPLHLLLISLILLLILFSDWSGRGPGHPLNHLCMDTHPLIFKFNPYPNRH